MKTTGKILLLLAAVLFVGSNAYAQSLPISLGVKAGVNLSNVNIDVDDPEDPDDTDARVGFQVGVDAKFDLPLTGLFLQSGLALTTKGFKADGNLSDSESFEVKANAMYLQLPIMAGYKVDAPGMGINFMVGPYFAYGIGGKTKTTYTDTEFPEDNGSSKEDTFDKDNGYKKFDMGLTGAVGVEISKFYVNLGYELGLSNIANKDSDDKVKNRNAFLTVGYKIF